MLNKKFLSLFCFISFLFGGDGGDESNYFLVHNTGNKDIEIYRQEENHILGTISIPQLVIKPREQKKIHETVNKLRMKIARTENMFIIPPDCVNRTLIVRAERQGNDILMVVQD